MAALQGGNKSESNWSCDHYNEVLATIICLLCECVRVLCDAKNREQSLQSVAMRHVLKCMYGVTNEEAVISCILKTCSLQRQQA